MIVPVVGIVIVAMRVVTERRRGSRAGAAGGSRRRYPPEGERGPENPGRASCYLINVWPSCPISLSYFA